MRDQLEQRLTVYDMWLERQPLAANTRNAYRLQVHHYGAYLAQRPAEGDDPLSQPFTRDYAVRDYKTYLKTERKVKPTSVNLALAAIDHFYQFLGSDRPKVQRKDLPEQSPRALKPEEQTARQLGRDAKLELSAHVLRHTCLTNLVRRGNDLLLVVEVAGHKHLETTRRYSLPSLADRETAMEGLRLEY